MVLTVFGWKEMDSFSVRKGLATVRLETGRAVFSFLSVWGNTFLKNSLSDRPDVHIFVEWEINLDDCAEGKVSTW